MPETLVFLDTNDLMSDPTQPRKSFMADEMSRLAESVAKRGILQPLWVIKDEQRKKYRIITGECRWRAAQMAGLPSVPCIVVTGQPDEADILADQISENEVRNALRPMELAKAIAKLKALSKANSLQLASELGLSPATLSRCEALLSLPPNIQTLVDEGRIPGATAYEISRLPDARSMQELAGQVAAGQVSRDQAAKTVRGVLGKKSTRPKKTRFAQKLEGGLNVSISATKPLTVEMLGKAAGRQGIDEIGMALKAFPDAIQAQEVGTIFSPTQGEIADDRKDDLPSPSQIADSKPPQRTAHDHGRENDHGHDNDNER
jgi:ParB family chromosome partitioning protein